MQNEDRILFLCNIFFENVVNLHLNVEKFFSEKTDNPRWMEALMEHVYSLLLVDEDLEASGIFNTEKEKSEAMSIKQREFGNNLNNARAFSSAIPVYTHSIAIAPQRSASTALALSFANRGAVLKTMGYLEDSISDTQRALTHGYPEPLQHKLYSRLGQCLQQLGKSEEAKEYLDKAMRAADSSAVPDEEKKKIRKKILADIQKCEESVENLVLSGQENSDDMGISEISPTPPPHLSQGPSQECSCLSKKVEIKYDAVRGRHLVAAEDIKPGDVLLVEPTNSAVLHDKFKWTHCSHCFQQCYILIPCPNCSWCMFCSDVCMSEAQEYHKIECGLVPLLRNSKHILNHGAMTLRVIATTGVEELCRIADEVKINQPSSSDEWRTLGFGKDGKFPSGLAGILSYQFEQKWPYHEVMRSCAFAVLVSKFLNLDTLEKQIKIGVLILKINKSLSKACHITQLEIHGSAQRFRAIGNCMCPVLSFLKHSCDPDVWHYHHKTTTVARAIQVIPKGSPVFMTYGRPFLRYTKQVRQADLKMLGVSCDCQACKNDYPLFENLPDVPFFEIPSELKISEYVTAGAQQLLKKAFDGDYVVNKETLPLFLKQIMIMHKCNKKINKRYYELVENVRSYFGCQGNLFIPDVPF